MGNVKSLENIVFSRLRDGDEGSRTPDLLNAIQARSQLRHAPKCLKKRFHRLQPQQPVHRAKLHNVTKSALALKKPAITDSLIS